MRRNVVLVVVEDDYGHFLLMRKYLEQNGVLNEIIWLPDGQEAMDFLYGTSKLQTRDPSKHYVMLLDIRMPKIDGIEVLERIRSDDSLGDVPVVMLTTTGNPHEIERCFNLGCNAYIVKPVRYNSYVDAMRKVGLFPSMVKGGVELLVKSIA